MGWDAKKQEWDRGVCFGRQASAYCGCSVQEDAEQRWSCVTVTGLRAPCTRSKGGEKGKTVLNKGSLGVFGNLQDGEETFDEGSI